MKGMLFKTIWNVSVQISHYGVLYNTDLFQISSGLGTIIEKRM